MSRINDVRGTQGFPPVQQEAEEPAFHADWEAHMFALNRALVGLLQNRILAKMISTKHPDRPSSRQVLPTSGVRCRPQPPTFPTGGPEQGNLQQPVVRRGICNLDEFRDAIERMAPQECLASSYYEKWFHAITRLLAQKGALSEEEIADG